MPSLSARRAWIEITQFVPITTSDVSLSARRAWIEISAWGPHGTGAEVALRKESVDRNFIHVGDRQLGTLSLSARRAWIEIVGSGIVGNTDVSRSPQGERG